MAALIGRALFCFLFGAVIRVILRSKWYGPGMVVGITVISAAISGSTNLWIQAAVCSATSIVGSLLGVTLAKLFKVNLASADDSDIEDSSAQ